MLKIILLSVFSYLIGSIPNAFWICKIFFDKDIRKYGSGNVGATNVARVFGMKYGVMTFLLDALKGAIPTYIGYSLDDKYAILFGLLAIIGHSYSIYIKFGGGKAVATSLGVFSVISPLSILVLLTVFFIIVYITDYVSLASIICAALLFICVIIFKGTKIEVIFSLLVGILVIYRHKSNIKNLINKKESKFSEKVNKK